MMPPDHDHHKPDTAAVHALVNAIKDSAHEQEVMKAVEGLGDVLTGICAVETLARLLLPHLRVGIGAPEGGVIEMEGIMLQDPRNGEMAVLDEHTKAAEQRVMKLLTLLSGNNVKAAMEVIDDAIEQEAAFGDMIVFLASLYRSAYIGALQARNTRMS